MIVDHSIIVLVVILPRLVVLVHSFADPSMDANAFRPLKKEEICPSMDIRNTTRNLLDLENCCVVEGFLRITLMNEPDSNFNNHSYPKLREITGYLLLHQVFGLRSIGQLFPNLAVIRGQKLLNDFSFLVSEMLQLHDIGLKSLTEVQRGSVLIRKNPNLCYAESIDWRRIGHAGLSNHLIQGNRKASECPKCPDHCPADSDGRRLCWNNDECQKVCDSCGSDACAIQSQTGERSSKISGCCHPECAGGCSGNHSNKCDVCKHVTHNDKCFAACPPGLYLFMKRRCVKDTECVRMPVPRELSYEHPNVKWNWKVFESAEVAECILECPLGSDEHLFFHYNSTLSYYRPTCVQSKGPKFCKSAFVNNIKTAQKLRGCTTIMGNLEILDIQIEAGDNVTQELERSLGSIEEIHGMLKVVRSPSLLSLGFFKNLRNITGSQEQRESSFENEYALIVQDNQNLQQLWPKSQNLTIPKKMLFRFNSILCYDKIEELYNSSRPAGEVLYPLINNADISRWTNGYNAHCNEQVLNITVISKTDKEIALKWNNFKATLADKRLLLSYSIYFIEAPNQNLTYYDGCDEWRVQSVAPKTDSTIASANETSILANLRPYTQYAIYVQTYTVASEATGRRIGARSNIIYDRTRPAAPDRPENLRANAISSSELVIEWDPPINHNGIEMNYIVYVESRPDDQEYVDQRVACAEFVTSVISETEKILEDTSVDNRTSIFDDPSRFGSSDNGGDNEGNDANGKCCPCSISDCKLFLEKKEKEQQFNMEFENVLRQIHVTTTAHSIRNKRPADTTNEGDENGAVDPHEIPELNPNAEVPKASNKNHTNTLYRRKRNFLFNSWKVKGSTNHTAAPLRHFTEYVVKVRTCLELDPATNKPLCSSTAATLARTKHSDFADEIESGVILYEPNSTAGSMRIGWNEPKDPNGLIVNYLIEYRHIDNAKPVKECVQREDYIEGNRTRLLTELSPGNYCIQVRAFSLAGAGPPTEEVCFVTDEPISVLSHTAISLIIIAPLMAILAAIAAVAYYLIRNKKNKHGHSTFSTNPNYRPNDPVPDDWEVARENVSVIRELCQGSFGKVYEGLLRDPNNPDQPKVKCAIKRVREEATSNDQIQFLNEANVMKEFNTHHVVKLLGVVSKTQPTLVIMEFMDNRDLKSYLLSHRPDCEGNISQCRQPPTLKDILKMATEIADGMFYLSEKKYVHRDLAARNCMVAGDLTVKIGDFGLTRDIFKVDYYRMGSKGRLPVRWMAPESLRDGIYTLQSDVWSFGVVLWEMATLASRPYQGLSDEQVVQYVIDGGIMERPEGCPDILYNLMESCWQRHARRRPTFVDIIENLLPDVPAQFSAVSFFNSVAGVSARTLLLRAHNEQVTVRSEVNNPLTSRNEEEDMLVLSPSGCSAHYRARHPGSSGPVAGYGSKSDLSEGQP